jgi:hypothetical protein
MASCQVRKETIISWINRYVTYFNHSVLLFETERWIDNNVQPNVYVVATLKQSCGTYAAGFKSWIRGNHERYQAVYNQFIRRLSQRIYGKSNYRRHGTSLPSAATLEGRGGARSHLNLLLRRPD